MSKITKKKARIVSQKKKRTLSIESAIVVLNYYADVAPGQRETLAHFKGTEHKINQPKLTALINGDGFKDWEADPRFVEARRRVRAKADRQNPNGPRWRTPDALDDVLTFKHDSPSSVYAAKRLIDEAWCRFAPAVREFAAREAAKAGAGGDPT